MDQDPPGRWAALGWLALAKVLAMTTWFSASAVLAQLRDEWGFSSAAGAWLTIAVQLGFVAGALLSAALNLADIVPPRRLMLLGATGAATANIMLLVSPGVEVAIFLRFATGAFLAGVYPPALKAMATWFRKGRGVALGVMVGALTLGSAMPHLVNGLGGVAWQPVIVATSLMTLAGGVVAVVAGRDGPYPFPLTVFDPRQAIRALGDRGVRLASLGYFGHMWELYAMWAWFAVFYADILDTRGFTEPGRLAGYATFAVIGVGAVGCWLGGRLGDRWGRTRSAGLAMGLSGACALAIGPMSSWGPWIVLGVGLVWGFWVVADSAQFSAMVTELADQRYVGTAVTLQLGIGFTLTVVTIWLVPVVRDASSWSWAFAMLALGPALGLVAMDRLRRSPRAAQLAGGIG